jgi:hypothetical protein
LLDRLSPKVIVREQTQALQRHELSLWLRLYLHVVYIVYVYLVYLGRKKRSPRA